MLARPELPLRRWGAVGLRRYLGLRRQQPHFANARSVRNALDRIRLRHATRLFGRRAGQSRIRAAGAGKLT
jgi:hypothetical protein